MSTVIAASNAASNAATSATKKASNSSATSGTGVASNKKNKANTANTTANVTDNEKKVNVDTPTNGVTNGTTNGNLNGAADHAPAQSAPPVMEQPAIENTTESAPFATEPKARMSVPKGSAQVQNTKKKRNVKKSPTGGATIKRAASKSPVTSPTPRASTAGAKRTASRSPAKSSSAGTKRVVKKASTAGAKRVVKKGAAKTAVKSAKPKRAPNTKPTQIETSGIGIGGAKVKKVLVRNSLNPVEYMAVSALHRAEKPPRAKPSEENPNPPAPEQVPIEKLDKKVLDVIKRAEANHQFTLRGDYEADHIKKMSAEQRTRYNEERKTESERHEAEVRSSYENHYVNSMVPEERKLYEDAMQKAREKQGDDFNLHRFNMSFDSSFYEEFDEWRTQHKRGEFDVYRFNLKFDPHFYSGLAAYVREHDRYDPNYSGPDADEATKTPWGRAATLIKKNCYRISVGVRNLLACYLDEIVMQYFAEGVRNCIANKKTNVQLSHALKATDGFDERVPIDAFVRTLNAYRDAITWLENCDRVREEAREMRREIKANKRTGDSVVAEMPAYPDPGNEEVAGDAYDPLYESFEGYITDICRYVRKRLAANEKNEAERAKYHTLKVSEPFKKFCSIVIYEAIMRIGEHIKDAIKLKEVKTVNRPVMYYTLRQISNLCGFSFEPIQADMRVRLRKFRSWCNQRRHDRRVNKALKAAGGGNNKATDAEKNVEVEAEAEVEAEESDDDSHEEEVAEESEEEVDAAEEAEEAAEEVEEEAAEEEEATEENGDEVQMEYEEEEETTAKPASKAK